ncbi:unnamed protein product [Cylicocyclus nassatus]|uniref:Domain of unknown function DB domain-containing protein n=1 Tax=Cylicocyclus nassatus TaxID=53992 RepID=A0AA36ME44_CYLNA|nr:unnamed protein product [Cylicocyclus nassatus]
MRLLWVIAAVVSVTTADLPSCERATCDHCNVEFIARMCERTCQACPRSVVDPRTGNRLKLYTEQSRQPLPTANVNVPQRQNVDFRNVVRQAGVPTQPQQPVPAYNPALVQLPRPMQLATPQAQVAPIQYPAPAGISTLAPMIPPPRPTDISSSLSRQPADLAQPLPEYQQGAQGAFPYSQPQTTQFQLAAPAQQQSFPTAVSNVQQPGMTDLFGRPLFSSQPQSSPIFNPFQPFMTQAATGGSQHSLLDPLGLFNMAGVTNFQGTSPPQVTQPHFTPQARSFGPAPFTSQQPAQSAPQPQQTLPAPYYNQKPAQTSQQNVNVQPARIYTNQPQQQNYQAYQNAQQIAYRPNTNPQQQLPQQANIATPRYQTNQAPVLQQYMQNQIIDSPQRSQSIDAAPINVPKYVDGKGAVPAPPPLTCPRQPGWGPCISKELANQRFARCCSRLGDGCIPLCNYDAPLSTMQLAVLTGRCPLNKMADIMVCASGYEDATACCEAYNVFEPGYEQCRPYCNPAAGLPQGGLLSEKYKCLAKLSTIQQCFYVSQKP